MPVKLLFLGKLADLAGDGKKIVEVAGEPDWSGLMACFPPELADALGSQKVRVAINGILVPDKRTLSIADGDEIAFLPPVSGG